MGQDAEFLSGAVGALLALGMTSRSNSPFHILGRNTILPTMSGVEDLVGVVQVILVSARHHHGVSTFFAATGDSRLKGGGARMAGRGGAFVTSLPGDLISM